MAINFEQNTSHLTTEDYPLTTVTNARFLPAEISFYNDGVVMEVKVVAKSQIRKTQIAFWSSEPKSYKLRSLWSRYSVRYNHFIPWKWKQLSTLVPVNMNSFTIIFALFAVCFSATCKIQLCFSVASVISISSFQHSRLYLSIAHNHTFYFFVV